MSLPRLDLATPTMVVKPQLHSVPQREHSGWTARVPPDRLAELSNEFGTCRGCRIVVLSDRKRVRRQQIARLRRLVGACNVVVVVVEP